MENVYMEKDTWVDILDAVREKLNADDYYKAGEVADKIREIGVPDTLSDYLSGKIKDLTYYGESVIPAFRNNDYIETVNMPNLRTALEYQFYNCTHLTSFSAEKLTDISIKGMFENCSVLKDVNLPNVIKAGGQYTFSGCSALEKLELPECKYFGADSFVRNNNNLKSIVVPKCTNFYNNTQAFLSTSLREIVLGTSECILANAPTNTFSVNFQETGSVYVPDEYVDSYKAATNWSVIADIIKPISERPAEEE